MALMFGLFYALAPASAQVPLPAGQGCDAALVVNCGGTSAPRTDPEHDASPVRNEFQITVGQENKRALLTLGRQLPNSSTLQWKATVSSPIDESQPETSLATLDGLASGTKLEVGLSYTPFEPSLTRITVAGLERACRLSKAALKEAVASRSPLIVLEPVAGLTAEEERQRRLQAEAAYRNAQYTQIDEQECDDRLYAQVKFEAPEYSDVALREVSQAYFQGRPIFTYGLKAGAGYDQFKFLDADFAATSSHETGYEVGVNVAMTDVVRLWSVVASVSRQRTYENTKSSLVQVCTPIANTPAERCLEGFSLPPTRKDNTVSALEWRYQSARNRAISVRTSYDHSNDVTGVSIPMYLLMNKDGKLAGGLKVGWRSDTDDTQIGVFVSAGFNL